MTEKEIAEKIAKIAYDAVGAELNEEENLKESGIDSLSLVAVIVAIEEAFGVAFSDDDLDPANLITLDDLVRITRQYQ